MFALESLLSTCLSILASDGTPRISDGTPQIIELMNCFQLISTNGDAERVVLL